MLKPIRLSKWRVITIRQYFLFLFQQELYSKDEWNAAFLGFDAIREAAKKANGFIIDPASIMYAVPNAPVKE
ncbi:MAG: hypothetical protein ACI4KB_10175 [Oscillospiraceae bacterium]